MDQTLPSIAHPDFQASRCASSDGPNLSVMPDAPFLKHYKVDYVNMARNVTGTVSLTPKCHRAPQPPVAARQKYQQFEDVSQIPYQENTSIGCGSERTSKIFCGRPTKYYRRLKRNDCRANKRPKLNRRRGTTSKRWATRSTGLLPMRYRATSAPRHPAKR